MQGTTEDRTLNPFPWYRQMRETDPIHFYPDYRAWQVFRYGDVLRVLSDSADHPDVEAVHQRAAAIDPKISIATVYRTVRLFQEASILERHDFGDGRARYEEMPTDHHDHLIDLQSGRVIEFRNEEIEKLQRDVAERLGYRLIEHRLELFAVPLNPRKAERK